jgi:glycosyltransferase involved in cell wall biosynthesis
VAGVPEARIHPLRFETPALPFPVPGMSDVMPYPSTVFSAMDTAATARYLAAWREHLGRVLDAERPDLVHVHHVWLVGALLKDLAPELPIVTHSHATGFRQLRLCPHLAQGVIRGVRRNDRFAVLHAAQAAEAAATLDVPAHRVRVVGTGYRDDLFRTAAGERGERILYVGKLSYSKGLRELIEAFSRLRARRPSAELHVVGSGAGAEAAALQASLEAAGPAVRWHGALSQADLAERMRSCRVGVLPSYYEGVPLVLAEALACGQRLVATALPGVVTELAPRFGDALELVPPPRLRDADQPLPEDLPHFVDALADALDRALSRPPLGEPDPAALAPFTWDAVFGRVEAIWNELLDREA